MSTTTTLARMEVAAITKAMTPQEMQAQVEWYMSMQKYLDQALADSIMTIQGKKFRKKAYWRAIAVAAGIVLDLVSEDRFDSKTGWGYRVSYRATLPGGRSMVGDGTCVSSEKRGAACTEHNVRAHAHTRAKNRAIADLVGFGEVTAEEINHNGDVVDAECATVPAGQDGPSVDDIKKIADSLNVPKATRIEIANRHGGVTTPEARRAIFEELAMMEIKEVKKNDLT